MSSKFKVPSTFTVPDTIEGVVGLLTARGWEKAAIVYAYTKPSQGKRSDLTSREIPQSFPCSYSEFANLGITGLRDRQDVEWYRRQYVKAIEDGIVEMVGPGDTIDVPTEGFPRHPRSYKPSTAAITSAIKADPRIVQDAIKADPKVADAAWETLTEEQEVVEEVTPEKVAAAIKAHPEIEKEARKAIYQKDVSRDHRAEPTIRDPRQDYDDSNKLIMRMRAAKIDLQEALSLSLKTGIADSEIITALAEDIRNLLTAIESAAHGDTLDDEIAALLGGGQ